MAKTSMVNRETKRAKLAKKFAAKREALKKIINSQDGDFDEKMAAAALKLKNSQSGEVIRSVSEG